MQKHPNLIAAQVIQSAKLTAHQWFVLCRHMEGWKQREIALEIGSSVPAVNKSIKLAIRKLRVVAPDYGRGKVNP